MSAKSEFKKVYHSDETNFMTPRVVRYGRRGGFVYELSVGDSIFREHKKLWGVTFVDPIEREKLYGLSKCFNSEKEAETYIKTV